jgi:hypothetical protein
MTGPSPPQLEQLLSKERRAFGNGIDHDLMREAQIAKGWVSQRAVVEEYYRLLVVRLREDQLPPQHPLNRLLVIKSWFGSLIGNRRHRS